MKRQRASCSGIALGGWRTGGVVVVAVAVAGLALLGSGRYYGGPIYSPLDDGPWGAVSVTSHLPHISIGSH
jgi:hypothetical protein